MDDKQHGPYEDSLALIIAMVTGKASNMDLLRKLPHAETYWVAAWDGLLDGGHRLLTELNVPISLERLRQLAFSKKISAKELARRVQRHGPIPRSVLAQNEKEADGALESALGGVTLNELMSPDSNPQTLSKSSVSFRIAYPHVNRKYGKTVGLLLTSEHVRMKLHTIHARGSAAHARGNVTGRTALKEARYSPGRIFDVDLVTRFQNGARLLRCINLLPAHRGRRKMTRSAATRDVNLPGNQQADGTWDPPLHRVDSYYSQSPPANTALFWWSFDELQPAVDFVVRSADEQELFLGQITFQQRHAMKAEEIVKIIKHMELGANARITVAFVVPHQQLLTTKFTPLKVKLAVKGKKMSAATQKKQTHMQT